MKRQRVVNLKGFEAAEMGTKKAKTQLHQNAEEGPKNEGKQMEMVGTQENIMGWTNWEENWPWIGGFVDEQMSWGSVWFPFWDMDSRGEAFGAMYGDVVWDDDLWNLKEEIPNPSES